MACLIRTANGLEISHDLDAVPDERELPAPLDLEPHATGFFKLSTCNELEN